MTLPRRGFDTAEYEARTAKAQAQMETQGISALLLTTEADVRYFSGFLTRFWESPTRPWFLIIPSLGKPIAVIPSIGADLMSKTWIEDIRTWISPDLTDDGVSLLADTLRELGCDRVGTPSGPETSLRLPLDSKHALAQNGIELISDQGIMRRIRMVKSPAEIEKIETACAIGTRAFERAGEIVQSRVPFDAIFRGFQVLCLEEGADYVPYLAGGFGPLGYNDVISPATSNPVRSGDTVMLDTGLVWDGYFCDFDRNFAIGSPTEEVRAAHARLTEATHSAFDLARPGIKASDLCAVMSKITTTGASEGAVGRLGHGLGMQLTEWPSLTMQDHTVLEAGMVLTLEPWTATSPTTGLVHEENIVITENGARPLTKFSPSPIKTLP